VALNPTDKAQALYLLAVAYQEAGDLTGARRAVLQALEIAPNFDDALELLLVLRSGLRGET
ncbi:MAG TPA: tetratricopeptide repeat protein, partial [Gemmatimonadetes bacterium]|nr:tetratricopeptide repeat protein [Gemmatimonadota bacterium]